MLWKDGYLMILPDAFGLGINGTHGGAAITSTNSHASLT